MPKKTEKGSTSKKTGKKVPTQASGSSNNSPEEATQLTIDPSTIPDSHRLCLKLDDGLDIFYTYDGVIWALRALFALNGLKLRNKPLSSKSSNFVDDFILVELSYYELKTSLLIEKPTVYLVAFTCQGKWKKVSDVKYNIQGAEDAGFNSRYPEFREYKIGVSMLRRCVYSFNSDNSDDWRDSFYNAAVNICEAARFPPIHKEISKLRDYPVEYSVLDGCEEWMITAWSKLSKVWKLWCKYEVWDPLSVIPDKYKVELSSPLRDHMVGEQAIALLLDRPIGKASMHAEGRGHVAKDLSVR